MILVSTVPRRLDRSILPLFRRQRKWLWASVRIGELVRELDTSQGARTDLTSSHQREEVSKTKAIIYAGLTVPTAHRYQELVGPRDQTIDTRNGRRAGWRWSLKSPDAIAGPQRSANSALYLPGAAVHVQAAQVAKDSSARLCPGFESPEARSLKSRRLRQRPP